MSNLTIEQQRERIALFDGCERKKFDCETVYLRNGHLYPLNYFKYNSDWSLLMPIVEKIESIHNGAYKFTIDPWSIVIIEYVSGNETHIVHVTREESKPIDDYFEAVCKFLDWYETFKIKP